MASTSWSSAAESHPHHRIRHADTRPILKRSNSVPDYGFPNYGPYRQRSESYKFIRMADDFHSVSNYLSEIRYCFIILTATVYALLLFGLIYWCYNRNRRTVNGNQRRPRSQWDYQSENQTDFRNPAQTEDLVSVRSDGQTALTTAPVTAPAYMGRNHRMAPTFMRHGLQMNHSSQTTRLVADNDGRVGVLTNGSVAGNTETTTSASRTDRDRDRGGGGGREKGKEPITDM